MVALDLMTDDELHSAQSLRLVAGDWLILPVIPYYLNYSIISTHINQDKTVTFSHFSYLPVYYRNLQLFSRILFIRSSLFYFLSLYFLNPNLHSFFLQEFDRAYLWDFIFDLLLMHLQCYAFRRLLSSIGILADG